MSDTQSLRHLRSIDNRNERYREWKVQRVMRTFDLDRNSAAQTLEWVELKFANQSFAAFCGAIVGIYVHKRMTPVLQARSLLFKKPWMVPIIPLFAYYCGYVGARQLRGRRFGGNDVTFESVSGGNDCISRFRNMDYEKSPSNIQNTLTNYLATTAVTSRKELEKEILECFPKNFNPYLKDKRVKRSEKDTDDLFWWFGKIHGLENIAFLSDDDIKRSKGNPIVLQDMVNKVKPSKPPANSFDGLVSETMKHLTEYKEQVNKFTLNRSDRAKLLLLPFQTRKRVQGPAPKKGMWQYELFTELANGKDWHHYDGIEYDIEPKITIYNYEKHLSPSLLERLDTESPEFKKQIKMMTIMSKTQFEEHKELKEKFRGLMNTLAFLNKDEGRAFIYLLKSKSRGDYLSDIHNGKTEAYFAKIAEEENYLKKNAYLLQRKKMEFARKEDMPIEKAKVKDLFKNAREFKEKFNSEFGLYDVHPREFDHQKRVVQELIEKCSGPLLALRDEVGLTMKNRFKTAFLRIKDSKELKEGWSDDPIYDHSMLYFLRSTFLPLDMTDYEDVFVGPAEDLNREMADMEYWKYENVHDPQQQDPTVDYTEKYNDFEPKFNFYRSNYTEENAPGDDEDDDEDEDEEGEGDEDEEEEEVFPEDMDEYFEPVDWEPGMSDAPKKYYGTHFSPEEKLRDKYDNVELDSFMKFLDVKPFYNWYDEHNWHSRLGFHPSEDFSQRVDPEHHMIADVERETFEKLVFKEHRTGATVRFRVGSTQPRFGPTID
jgi:hypothetical protein